MKHYKKAWKIVDIIAKFSLPSPSLLMTLTIIPTALNTKRVSRIPANNEGIMKE